MVYQIPKQLKEEYKIFDHPCIWWKDVVTCVMLFGVFLILNSTVHSWFRVPYWITAAAGSYFLIQPARGNPKKRNWEAIILMLSKDYVTHESINHVQDRRNGQDAQ
jgi:hypothetical protein